jgi:hypothetical protein
VPINVPKKMVSGVMFVKIVLNIACAVYIPIIRAIEYAPKGVVA